MLLMKIKVWLADSKKTLFEARKHILFSVLIFAFGIVVGYLYLGNSEYLREGLAGLFKSFSNKTYFQFTLKIFIHNLIVAYLSMRLGLLFGILPALSAFGSGVSVGWLFANAGSAKWYKLVLLLSPHGIFEIPAMMLAWGVGFWRARLLFVPNYEKITKTNVRQVHKVFLVVVMPLLFVAAMVEGWPLLFK